MIPGRSPQGECGLKFLLIGHYPAATASLPARGVWIEIGRSPSAPCRLSSLPARGVWIEIRTRCPAVIGLQSRSPQGECGLKFLRGLSHILFKGSLPARGVWIEIGHGGDGARAGARRSPQGECGLKFTWTTPLPRSLSGRSPQGECGLKFGMLGNACLMRVCRSPQGECGLKSFRGGAYSAYKWLLPVKGGLKIL